MGKCSMALWNDGSVELLVEINRNENCLIANLEKNVYDFQNVIRLLWVRKSVRFDRVYAKNAEIFDLNSKFNVQKSV